eukprot:TRINITY_DN15095_c0_g1_i1.p1 TRINITY_DN15095_c0_g1~~TRINITY_DN15095_c0_g1_i1.p1  ORF type:complete len:353 (-),score=50.73 TRINITY_DN15095_c0_g1_i1:22-1080(-)
MELSSPVFYGLNHLAEKSDQDKPILVLGAGVIGLSTALQLLILQYSNVTVLSEHFPPFTTSDGAGGVWFPYKAEPLEKVIDWAIKTREVLKHLTNLPECGVSYSTGCFVEVGKPESEPWWKTIVENYRVLEKEKVPHSFDYGYECTLPVIETHKYLQWLMIQIVSRGGKLVQHHVKNIKDCIQRYRPHAVINCTGIGSNSLFQDSLVYPVRGLTLKLRNLSNQRSSRWYLSETDKNRGLIYVFIRNDITIVGGTVDEKVNEVLVPKERIDKIYQNAIELVPELKNSIIVDKWSGLRPYREKVRLEIDDTFSPVILIHNYGHGGSGWTVHWACAQNAVSLLQSASKEIPKSKM